MKFTIIFIAAIIGVSSANTIPQYDALQIRSAWKENLDQFNQYLGYSENDLYNQFSRYNSTFYMNFPYYQTNYQYHLLPLGSEGEAIAARLDAAFNQTISAVANIFNETALRKRINSLLRSGTNPFIKSVNASITVLTKATKNYPRVATCWNENYQQFLTIVHNFYWSSIANSIMNQQMTNDEKVMQLTSRMYLNLNGADASNCYINVDQQTKCFLDYYKKQESAIKREFAYIRTTVTSLINGVFTNLRAEFSDKREISTDELSAWIVTVTQCFSIVP